jgi:hypothetical protein
MKKMIILFVVLFATLATIPAFASQIRVFVTDFDATGVQNRDELKVTLQTLLTSRMNGDKAVTVGSVAESDAVVSGTYISIGKVFSLDAVAKTPAGKTLARAFVQGDNKDELIPAVGQLAEKLTNELVKLSFESTTLGQPALPIAVSVPKSDVIINDQIKTAVPGEFIKPSVSGSSSAASGWLSPRIGGVANLLAIGKSLSDGSREIFLAEGERLAYYRQGSDMKLIAESELGSSEKIISLDTIVGDDGNIDIFVTIIRSGELASQVWQVKEDKLVLVVKGLPYYFRSASLLGGTKKLYAQSMGRSEDFYADVAEATRNGSSIVLKNPLKMPRYGTIYSFNQFKDKDGKIFTAVINPDGYLIVYDQKLSEIWRSNDKFGGSELYFQKDNDSNVRITGDAYRWIFLNQRIQISAKGEILVGKNGGFWVLGNARSYKSGAVYCLVWNGSSLEEKWRTRETQNYMPDYLFDDTRNELLLLQTVQRPGINTRGATTLSIKKVE